MTLTLQRSIYFLLGLLLLVTLAIMQRPDGRLHIFFLETTGDAALLQTPSGAYILIDGGSDPVALASALGHKLPFWKRSIDAIILTLPDQEHLPGLIASLARYRISKAIAPELHAKGSMIAEWRRLIAKQQVPLQITRDGDIFAIDKVQFKVLEAGDGATHGMILRLDYGTTSVVFAHSGASADEEQLAAHRLRTASLVVFPWQRDPSTTFMSILAPKAIVFSDGDRADQPVELTLPERATGGARLYHERLHGLIEWRSDGRHSTIQVERHYCSPDSSSIGSLFSPFHSDSASCSKRERS